jgi:hypothetical protein
LIAATPPPVRVEGNDLVFLRDERLPHVCLKCGAPSKTTRTQTLHQANATSGGMGAIGGVAGAAIAQQAHGDIATAITLGAGAAAVVGVVVWLLTSTGNKPTSAIVDLPLCDACDARWSAGVTVRGYILAGLGLTLIVALFGALSTLTLCYWIAAALFVGTLGFAITQRLPQRFIAGARIDETTVRLTNLPRATVTGLREALEAPPKKKKKKKPVEPVIEYGPL